MDKILNILKTIHPKTAFEESKNFVEDELLDSFDVIELISCIEEEFGISIDGLDILPENFCDLESIAAVIEKNGGTV